MTDRKRLLPVEMPVFLIAIAIAAAVAIAVAIAMIIPIVGVIVIIRMIGRCCILLHIQTNRLIWMLCLIGWTNGRCENLLHSI